MGQQQSKADKLVYKQVLNGNADKIQVLHAKGARLEYTDKKGKTPLIAACLNPALEHIVDLLIQLGANVNAYSRGRNGGTPLHHAARQGSEVNVNRLLSHGALALLLNDDEQTPLDIARANGFTSVVRAIEGHICLYSGWLTEQYGPNLLSRNVWVVVLLHGTRQLMKPLKLELVIYRSTQDARPRVQIPLSRASVEAPTFGLPNPAITISEASTRAHVRLVAMNEAEEHQLQQFWSALHAIPQVPLADYPLGNAAIPHVPVQPTAPPEEEEFARTIPASLESIQESFNELPFDGTAFTAGSFRASSFRGPGSFRASSFRGFDEASSSRRPLDGASSSSSSFPVVPPPPVHPDLLCAICLAATLDGTCLPCGHLAGCMACMSMRKDQGWGCPYCNTVIDKVMKIYPV